MNGFWAAMIAAIVAIASIAFYMNGDGGIKGMVTLSGIYAVSSPSGYPVVCFVERSAHAIDCITTNEMKEE